MITAKRISAPGEDVTGGSGADAGGTAPKHLLQALDLTNIGSFELDISTGSFFTSVFTFISQEQYRIFGYDPGQMAATNEMFFRRLHSADRPFLIAAFNKAICENGILDIKYRIGTGNGSLRHLWVRGRVIVDELAAEKKLIALTQDITDLRKAERDLATLEQDTVHLLRSVQEVLFSVDMEQYQTIRIYGACEAVYGYSASEFMQDAHLWYKLILESDRKIIDAKNSLMFSGEAFEAEYRIRHKNGSIRWVLTKVTPTLNAQATLVRVDGVTTDITAGKERETAIKTSGDRYRSLFKNYADALMVVDGQLKIMFLSPSFCDLTSFAAREVIGKQATDFVHADEQVGFTGTLQYALSSNGPTAFTHRQLKSGGAYIWCEGTATNLMQDPAVRGILIIFRDVSDRRGYEMDLKASNEALRTSNIELDRLVYSVTHDLKAPLSSISGIINLAQNESDPATLKDYLRMIEESTLKLDAFISDTLSYSRGTSTKLATGPLDFEDMLAEISGNLRFMGGRKTVAIHINVDSRAAFASDKNRVSTILNNLISNAIRYSDADKQNPFVSVNIVVTKGKALIKVKDNGIGIALEAQDRIFDMFYRVSDNLAGSGLGLYIVKEAVTKLGGQIQLQSTPEVGTEFTVTIPNLSTE